MNISIFDHFEWISPYYDRLIRSEKSDHIIELAGLPIGGAILDVGGGTGRISQWLVGSAGSIVIADYSIGMLRQAQKKKDLKTICAQSEKLPFAPMIFECVIMVDAFHHVINQYETLHEIWRVLMPGGKVIIEEPDVSKFAVKVVAAIEKLLLMRSHFLKPDRIAKILKFPNALTAIKREGHIAWVIIEKI
jgi:demethylmenaquinone methyltransferase/2-methoxy-6-polyprenyl-1,4-benzoquinol methylase